MTSWLSLSHCIVLSAQGWGLPQDDRPLCLGGAGEACLSLSGQADLIVFSLPRSFLRDQAEGKVRHDRVVCGRQKERGRGGLFVFAHGSGVAWPKWIVTTGPSLARLPEQLAIRCLQIPQVS